MNSVEPNKFRHTTLTKCPDKIAGIVLVDEEPGFTGIYLKDPNGGLWPARTVNHEPPEHCVSVCQAWMKRPGDNEDRRTQPLKR